MFVQVGVWGTPKLARYLMERQYPQLWLHDVDEKTKKAIYKLHPVAIDSTFQHQNGSNMPKLIRYYDIPDDSGLANDIRLDLLPYRNRMDALLASYMGDGFGGESRFFDHDDIEVYPYLSVESADYFTTHNMYSMYASEDFLRLLHRQLQNFSSEHCFMTQIRAYDPQFDACYQSISVKNPSALKDYVCDEPVEIKQSWLGQHEYGYMVHELPEMCRASLSSDDLDSCIAPSEVNKLINTGKLDKELISKIELTHNIKWCEPFDEKHVSFMYDLLGIRSHQNYAISHSPDVQFLDFDWDSLA